MMAAVRRDQEPVAMENLRDTPSSRPRPLAATEIDLADRVDAIRRLASNVCRIGDYHLRHVRLNGVKEVALGP
jgi:hypothetical protein